MLVYLEQEAVLIDDLHLHPPPAAVLHELWEGQHLFRPVPYRWYIIIQGGDGVTACHIQPFIVQRMEGSDWTTGELTPQIIHTQMGKVFRLA